MENCQIEIVSSCRTCQFLEEGVYGDYCNLLDDLDILPVYANRQGFDPETQVHERCPLRTKSILFKLAE